MHAMLGKMSSSEALGRRKNTAPFVSFAFNWESVFLFEQ